MRDFWLGGIFFAGFLRMVGIFVDIFMHIFLDFGIPFWNFCEKFLIKNAGSQSRQQNQHRKYGIPIARQMSSVPES